MEERFVPRAERVQVQRIGKTQVAFILDLTNLSVNIDGFIYAVQQLLNLLVSLTPARREPGEKDYPDFCSKFKLRRNRTTRRGFDMLARPESIAQAECSVRLTNCLEVEGIATLLQAVLMTKAELCSLRNFGETTFAELQDKASRYSGLEELRWW